MIATKKHAEPDFAPIRWDNVKPIPKKKERRILRQFIASQRVGLDSKKVKPTPARVRAMRPQAVAALAMFAVGMSGGTIADELGCHPADVARTLRECDNYFRLDARALHDIGRGRTLDEAAEAIKAAASAMIEKCVS